MSKNLVEQVRQLLTEKDSVEHLDQKQSTEDASKEKTAAMKTLKPKSTHYDEPKQADKSKMDYYLYNPQITG